MKTGKVKWFNDERGYGFITGDDGVDYFVHFSGINGKGHRMLAQDQRVSFDTESDDKGTHAVNVSVIG